MSTSSSAVLPGRATGTVASLGGWYQDLLDRVKMCMNAPYDRIGG